MPPSQNQKFDISAEWLGPIFSLGSALSGNDQNLIFARNGTGKSFLSRAFWYLDLKGRERLGKNISLDGAARDLLSKEAPDKKGKFSFARGGTVMGKLELDKKKKTSAHVADDTIFHVFSDEFIRKELRERKYIFDKDKNIKDQIIADMDSDNIQLQEAQEALRVAESEERVASTNLREKFYSERESKLVGEAKIRRNVREYEAMSFDRILEGNPQKPSPPAQGFAALLADLKNLESIPEEPTYPQRVDFFEIKINLSDLEVSLRRKTPPADIPLEIRRKIEKHDESHKFYKTGIDIVKGEELENCPFCEQDITNPAVREIINIYAKYFNDEEEKHKEELREFYRVLNSAEQNLQEHVKNQFSRQKSEYDALKLHFPSQREFELAYPEEFIRAAQDAILTIKSTIESKARELSTEITLLADLSSPILVIAEAVIRNNRMVAALNEAVQNSNDERLDLQREACHAFEHEFIANYRREFEDLRKLQVKSAQKKQELEMLGEFHLSDEARECLANDFTLLLRQFFDEEKYMFDKENYTLKHGGNEMENEMERETDRTLSDGEKAVVGFCYFIACIHKKVKRQSDYRKLFLVFDDPVTSMSYDFIFGIAQILKDLNLSNQGRVSLNPRQINENGHMRPNLLILTHNAYFFNICQTNGIVGRSAALALYSENNVHKIDRLNRYLAPFHDQLKDVYETAKNNRDPKPTTASAIRSVLEAIGRFCQPDQSRRFSDFIQYLGNTSDIKIKSILINWFCHGTYYEEAPSPDDIKLACRETLLVVKKYAPGQLEILRGEG